LAECRHQAEQTNVIAIVLTMPVVIASPVPLVRADGKGYTYAGESVDGFADRPELPQVLRVRLARLGERYAPEWLSPVQRELLASPLAKRDAARQPSAVLDGFQANAADAEKAWEEGVYAQLSATQMEWVADPGSHPFLERGTRYPLTLRHLRMLSGVDEGELRRLTEEGLIPAHPTASGRSYFSVAVARALLVAQARSSRTPMDSLAVEAAMLAADPKFAAEWTRLVLARTVAASLIGYRADHGFSQRRLADRLGTSTSRVVELESGEVSPTLGTLAKIAAATGIEFAIDVVPAGCEPRLVSQAVTGAPTHPYAGASVRVAAV
jgi:DNA-binding XRE family transcriptional regulator